MKLKEYAFQLRNDGSLKCLPLPFWRQVLNRTQPLTHSKNKTLTFAEIKVKKSQNHSHDVCFMRLWKISFNQQGFADHKEWKMSERPDINTMLGQLFKENSDNIEVMITQFIDSIVNTDDISAIDSRSQVSIDMNQQEIFVNKLLAI